MNSRNFLKSKFKKQTFQVILLGLKLEELSWDYAKPSQENNDDCLPCLFIQVSIYFLKKNYKSTDMTQIKYKHNLTT